MIPEEAVEVAAKDIFRVAADFAYDEGTWEELAEESRQAFRDDARRILEAAAPHLIAAHFQELNRKAIERELANPLKFKADRG